MAFLHAHAQWAGVECLLWPFGKTNGYGTLGGKTSGLAHREMCILAHGEPPFSGAHAAHSCGNGHLGCVNPNHLRWADADQNSDDRLAHGTFLRGTKIYCAKLTEDRVLSVVADPRTDAELAQIYECSRATISDIRAGRTWGWLTGIKRAA